MVIAMAGPVTAGDTTSDCVEAAQALGLLVDARDQGVSEIALEQSVSTEDPHMPKSQHKIIIDEVEYVYASPDSKQMLIAKSLQACHNGDPQPWNLGHLP